MSMIDWLVGLARRHPVLNGPMKLLNRVAINHFATTTEARPRAFSLWSSVASTDPSVADYITDYSSWPGLTNKRYSGRHLPPAAPTYIAALPPDIPYSPASPQAGDITQLFARNGTMKAARSSLLFMFFAQWFTDSILRINIVDRRMNRSNHDIDLCQIYGLSEDACRLLRTNAGGKLRSQTINGEEYLDYLGESNGDGDFTVKNQYTLLEVNTVGVSNVLADFAKLRPDRRSKLYATGLERGNSSIGYVAISTIFMREHNRIAAQLAINKPNWNDERIFQTARNINIVILMKLVVEDYINHILGYKLFRLDHAFAEKRSWYRANWIALEFDLLYRWHGLPPEAIVVNGASVPATQFRYNNALLESVGVGPLIDSVSRQPAGKIGLGNTPSYLWGAEYQSIKMGRDFRLQPYNAYRELFGLARKRSFAELTTDAALQARLTQLYDNIDNLEFFVGLFAEEADEGLLFGELLNRMVAYDAFTQIFSNPLLSKNVYNEKTFTEYGLALIEETTSIEKLVNRNVSQPVRASLDVIHQ